MLPYIYHIRKTSSIQESQSETVVRFSDGTSAILPKTTSGQPGMRRLLDLSGDAHSPVAVAVDDQGNITDVAGAERDIVLGVEDKGGTALGVAVWFGKMDGPMTLPREHPKFQEMVALLAKAAAGNEIVWYATKGGCVLEAMALTHAEDAALCQPA